jgi:hypothetical protein
LAELKELTLINAYNDTVCRIPTLREFFTALKDYDIMFDVEFKQGDVATLSKQLAAMIEEFSLEDRVVFITGNGNYINGFESYFQGNSLGILYNATTQDDEAEVAVGKIFSYINKYNCFYSPTYTTFTADVLRQMLIRGVNLWSWTYDDETSVMQAIQDGAQLITTNRGDMGGVLPQRLLATLDASLSVGESVAIQAEYVANLGNTACTPNVFTVLDGAGIVDYENGKIIARANGEATITFGYTYAYLGKQYTVYSAPITIVVSESQSEANSANSETISNSTDTSSEKKTGCGSSLTSGIVAVLCVCGILLALKPTNKDMG